MKYPSDLETLVQKAFARRSRLIERLESEQTEVYRLFQGDTEGCKSVVIDRYGEIGVLTYFEATAPQLDDSELMRIASAALALAGLRSVYLKRYPVDRSASHAPQSLSDPNPFLGDPVPERIAVRENGKSFWIRPYDGYSTGLFLDQRDNRKWFAERVMRGRVLNLFAYTCGFSVYAASLGIETTSVDVSSRYLNWGRDNFELNQISCAGHRFIKEDARAFVLRALKRGERYDGIVADPPTFGRSDRGVFRVQKDFPPLVESLAELLSPGGTLYVSANCSEWLNPTHAPRIRPPGAIPISPTVPGVPRDFDTTENILWYLAWQKKS